VATTSALTPSDSAAGVHCAALVATLASPHVPPWVPRWYVLGG
jgi:hypothetical protein